MAEEKWTVERLQTELLNAEKSGRFTLEELTPLWEQAKEAIESEEHAVSLYTTYIYLTRRYLAKQGSNDYAKVDELFREASDFLVECFAEEYSEASARFEKNYAFFLYTKMKRPSQAREIWGRLLESESGPFAWLEAVSLERAYGDVDFARRLFYKALDAVTFRPHEIYSAFVQFEREEGTREDLDRALEKINTRVAELNTKSTQQQYFRQKQQQIGDNKQKQQPRKDNKGGNRPQQKRAENGAAQADQRKPFKKESAAGGERPTKGAHQQQKRQQQQQSRQKVVEAKSTRKGEERMEVAEEDEKAMAGLFATSTVPLGPMIPGMSAPQPEPEAEEDKEMEDDKEMVPQPPPAMDAEKEEQPAAPSEEGKQLKRKRQTSSSSAADKAFPFNAGLEKNKLFVKQLHFGCKEAELKDFFTKFGNVTGVRIVTKWDGRSKGCAYVDFATDEEASNAIMGADGAVIRGKKIAVYLSNPPPKKPRLDQQADSGGCAVTAASVKRQDEGQGNSSSAPSAIQPKASTNKLSFAPRVLAGGQRSGRGSRLQMLPRSISKTTSNTLEQATTATNTFSPVGAVTHSTEEMNLGQNNMNKSEAEVNGGNSKN